MDRFCFWSVGQGLFYTGLLDDGNYNFVYDCGGESFERAIIGVDKFYADCLLNKTPLNLDFVMISCLNAEHFNGLYYLSQKFKIRKLYLPYISHQKSVVKAVLTCAVFGYNFIERESAEYDSAFKLLNFLLALYGTSDGVEFESLPEVELLGRDKENDEILRFNGQNYWQFVMINRRVDEETLQKITCAVDELVCGGVGLVEYTTKNKGNFLELKRVYEQALGNERSVASTILLHYPLYAMEFTCAGLYYYRNEVGNILPITMLTGDAVVDERAKERIGVETYGYGVYVLQLPNHGSASGWEQIKNCFRMFDVHNLVICHGDNESGKYPATEVVREIKEKYYAPSYATNAQTVKYWIRKYNKELDY